VEEVVHVDVCAECCFARERVVRHADDFARCESRVANGAREFGRADEFAVVVRAARYEVQQVFGTDSYASVLRRGPVVALEYCGANCIKLCQDDTLCVGWTYRSGACGLWASVPKQAPSAFTLSSRAPSFAQAVAVVSTASPAPPQPPQPRHEQASVALLGGNDRAEPLRPRFGDGN